MKKLFELTVARRHKDGTLPTKIGFFPNTSNKYSFFSREHRYRWLESLNSNKELMDMKLADALDDPRQTHQKRFADIHYNRSAIANYIVISERFKVLLEKFQLTMHAFYPVQVSGLNEVRKYYILHIVRPFEYLAYKKSQFGLFNRNGFNIGFHKLLPIGYIKSYHHLNEFKKQYTEQYLKTPEIYISERKKKERIVNREVLPAYVTFEKEFDVVAPLEGFGILINDRVKQAIEKSDLTCWEIKDYQNKDFKLEMPDTTTI